MAWRRPGNRLQWNLGWNLYISFKKTHLKLSLRIWRPFCFGLNVVMTNFLLLLGEDSHLHQCVSSYLSDMWLLFTALVPFPKFRPSMMASLDHSMWFHAPFHADQWMLYECESPYSGMHTLQCHYNTAIFFPKYSQETTHSSPIGRGMGCLLWVQTYLCHFYIWHCMPNILLWSILCKTVGLPSSTGEFERTARRQFHSPTLRCFRGRLCEVAAGRGPLKQSRWPESNWTLPLRSVGVAPSLGRFWLVFTAVKLRYVLRRHIILSDSDGN